MTESASPVALQMENLEALGWHHIVARTRGTGTNNT